jgi:ATP-dependent protease HslVU (ClpYQ) ATPase subunit
MCKKTRKSFLGVEATQMLDVSSIGEDFPLLVRHLVRAGLEHLDDDIGPLPWW